MKVTIIGKPDCHLCEVAENVVKDLIAGSGIEFEKLSVSDDPKLAARYSEEIPVILIDGKVHDIFRVDEKRFLNAIGHGSTR
ncbi:MAG: glutaredoxin family protein [Actinobacteria bacterium]|nr:MAG: glutaredoxin family protein [Actinomycetota bacterium]